MRNLFFLLLALYVFFSVSCKEKREKSIPPLDAKILLQTPTHKLLPPFLKKKWSFFHLGSHEVQKVSLQFLHKKKKRRFELFLDGKQWWIIEKKQEEESYGQFISFFSIQKLIGAMKKSTRIENILSKQTELTENMEIGVSFWGENNRFLAKINKNISAENEKSKWILYRAGHVFQQPEGKELTDFFHEFRKKTIFLAEKGKWLALPLQSWSMDFRKARKIALQLALLRSKLSRCFQKKSFPLHTGTLKMKLSFSNDGKVKHLKIETKAHQTHKLVWCVWWFAKKWTVSLPQMDEFAYRLKIPPKGIR